MVVVVVVMMGVVVWVVVVMVVVVVATVVVVVVGKVKLKRIRKRGSLGLELFRFSRVMIITTPVRIFR